MMLNEMMNTVGADMMRRLITRHIAKKYGGRDHLGCERYIKFSDRAINFRDEPSCSPVFYCKICGRLADALTDNYGNPRQELEDELGRFAEKFGYNVAGVTYWPGDGCYAALLEPDRVRPIDLSGVTPYYRTYYRETFNSPELVSRIGFRQMGHFYAYHTGRYIAVVCYICDALGIPYTDRKVHDAVIEKICTQETGRKKKDIKIALDTADDEDNRLPYGIGFGIYRYEFRWDGQPYIDPMDGRDYLDELTADDLDEICAGLTGLRTVNAVMRALDEMDINWFLPVKISDSVPPRDIRYLYNAYDAMCDAVGVKGRFYGGNLPTRNPNGRP